MAKKINTAKRRTELFGELRRLLEGKGPIEGLFVYKKTCTFFIEWKDGKAVLYDNPENITDIAEPEGPSSDVPFLERLVYDIKEVV